MTALAAERAARAGLPVPKASSTESYSPNAFSAGRNTGRATITATTRIRRRLTREE